ncbi:MAG: fimbrillin family protein [Rikenellaceae bacterium]
MKKILYIITMALAITLASCQKDDNGITSSVDQREVAFSATPISLLTRVSGTKWDDEDAIGITMLTTANQKVVYDNVKYVAKVSDEGTTSFSAYSDPIYYTEEGSKVDFVAFYPYQESWSYSSEELVFDISAQDGTVETQEMADLLVSNNLTAQTEGAQVLEFGHGLCKLQITVSNTELMSRYENLDGLTATVTSCDTKYDVKAGAKVESENIVTYNMYRSSGQDNEVVFTAIILPGEVSYEICFGDEDATYTTNLNLEQAAAGTQYNYTTEVGYQGCENVELTSTGISAWGDSGLNSALDTDISVVNGVYQIYTAVGLQVFASIVNSGTTAIDGQLMNDIDLGGIDESGVGIEENQWTPIGNSSTPYVGSFEGGDYKVSGLYINSESANQGLFGYVGSEGAIQNLGVSGSVTGGDYVGGIAGSSNSTITNCYNVGGKVSGVSNIGGVVGQAVKTTSNCYNTASVSGSYINVGGVVGYAVQDVSDSYNTGAVVGNNNYVGGIVGQCSGSASIANCYNKNRIEGIAYVGGITGSSSTITNCYNEGSNIEGDGGFVGGIAGYSSSTITNCYNTAKVTGLSDYVGGVAGRVVRITSCYNIAEVDGGNDCTNVGGVAGEVSLRISNCYYNNTVCSEGVGSDPGAARGLTDEEMKSTGFLNFINNAAYRFNSTNPDIAPYAWKSEGGYPVFDSDKALEYTDVDIYYDVNSSVYQMYTGNALWLFADLVNGSKQSVTDVLYEGADKYFDFGTTNMEINGQLMKDVNLGASSSKQWTPIGNQYVGSIFYKGTFDGGYNKISGLDINSETNVDQGLFGFISNATIKNLGVSGNVTGVGTIAGLAAYVRDASTICNCYSEVNVKSTNSSSSTDASGGLIGVVQGLSSYIYNCYNRGNVSSLTTRVGGVAGYNNGKIENCYNSGSISSSSTSTTNKGAVVGYMYSNATVTNCYYDTATCSFDGVGSTSGTITNVRGYSTTEMKSSDFVTILNTGASIINQENPTNLAYAWNDVSGSYPTLDYGNENPPYEYVFCTTLGSGTEGDPYQIVNATQMRDLATTVNVGTTYSGIYFKLMNDIDLKGSSSNLWTPIGVGETTSDAFCGVFDGDSHSITGLYVDGSSNLKALFGSVYGGTIKNLKVKGTVTSTAASTGIIAGYSRNATFISCTTLEGSSVTGGGNNTGGVAGCSYGSTFTDCHNNASVSGSSYTGGIVGYCYANEVTIFTNCSNTGKITNSSTFTGGIAGKIFGTSGTVTTMTNCANSGYISGDGDYVGGLVAANQGGAIYNSYNLGEVYGESSNVGGLVGIHESNNGYAAVLGNCYTSAKVTGTSNSTTVGLAVGNCSATIIKCYYDSSQSGSAIGTKSSSQSVTAYTSLSSLLTDLNSITSNITDAETWVTTDSDDYPTFSFLIE